MPGEWNEEDHPRDPDGKFAGGLSAWTAARTAVQGAWDASVQAKTEARALVARKEAALASARAASQTARETLQAAGTALMQHPAKPERTPEQRAALTASQYAQARTAMMERLAEHGGRTPSDALREANRAYPPRPVGPPPGAVPAAHAGLVANYQAGTAAIQARAGGDAALLERFSGERPGDAALREQARAGAPAAPAVFPIPAVGVPRGAEVAVRDRARLAANAAVERAQQLGTPEARAAAAAALKTRAATLQPGVPRTQAVVDAAATKVALARGETLGAGHIAAAGAAVDAARAQGQVTPRYADGRPVPAAARVPAPARAPGAGPPPGAVQVTGAAATPAAPPAHPNIVQIPVRSTAQMREVRAQNVATLGEHNARGLEQTFGNKVPTKDVFERGFGLNNGTRAEVNVQASHNTTRVEAQVRDAQGHEMLNNCSREYTRDSNGNLSVYHAHFNVKPEFRSSGAGAQILSNSVRMHHELGVKTISTTPAGSNQRWDYDKWKQNQADNKKNVDDHKAGRKTFDQMKSDARSLDPGYIGPHAWSNFGFKHSGSYQEKFADFLHKEHHEHIAKEALGATRHAEIKSRVERGESPAGARSAGPRNGGSAATAHVDTAAREMSAVASGPHSTNPRVAAGHAALATVERHRAAGTLTREHLVKASAVLATNFRAEQAHSERDSGPRRALNQASIALNQAHENFGRDPQSSYHQSAESAYASHLTPAEKTRVKEHANNIAAAAGGQGRDIIHVKLGDGREVGSHFMANFASNPHPGQWSIKIDARDKGWQTMKKKLRLDDLDP